MPRTKKSESTPNKKTSKKDVSDSSSSSTKSSRDSSTNSSGGLGVVVVLLVGMLIIGALFIAVQNSKTSNLEKEVTLLSGELDGKLAELDNKIATTKEDQEKQNQEALKRALKMYTSENQAYEFRYPVAYIAQELNSEDYEGVLTNPVQMVKESELGLFGSTSDVKDYVFVAQYPTEENMELSAWLVAHSEDYRTMFKEDMEITKTSVNDTEYSSYVIEEDDRSVTHFYMMNESGVFALRAVKSSEGSDMMEVVDTVLDTFTSK